MADIIDGTSNTLLLGEKYVNPDNYLTGQDPGDDWNFVSGCQDDIVRGCGSAADGAAYFPRMPMQDTPGFSGAFGCTLYFGSAHSNTLNMSLCDGFSAWHRLYHRFRDVSPLVQPHGRTADRRQGVLRTFCCHFSGERFCLVLRREKGRLGRC